MIVFGWSYLSMKIPDEAPLWTTDKGFYETTLLPLSARESHAFKKAWYCTRAD